MRAAPCHRDQHFRHQEERRRLIADELRHASDAAEIADLDADLVAYVLPAESIPPARRHGDPPQEPAIMLIASATSRAVGALAGSTSHCISSPDNIAW